MRNEKWYILCIVAIVLSVTATVLISIDETSSDAADTTFDFDEINYEVVSVTEVKVTGANYSTGTLKLVSSVVYEGITYHVTSIGEYAFYDFSGFTGSLTIPSSVTTIGNYAFGGCLGFTGTLMIPSGVTSIGCGVFAGCSGFTSLTIPDSVTSIGDWAFDRCCGFTSLTIPDSVTSIGNYVFEGCFGFRGTLMIPSGVTSIGCGVFAGCSGFTSLTIPDSVTSIDDWAFQGCSGFTSLTIPDSVTSIGDWVFCGCSGFTSIIIPLSVTTLGSGYCPPFRCMTFYAEDGSTILSQTVENLCGYTFVGIYSKMVRQFSDASSYKVSFSSEYGYNVFCETSATVSSGGSVTFTVSVYDGYILNSVDPTNGTLASTLTTTYVLSDITADSYVDIKAYAPSTSDTYVIVGVAVAVAILCLSVALIVFFKKK